MATYEGRKPLTRKVAIVGSREGVSPTAVKEFVNRLEPTHVVISGGAPGADTYAQEAAEKRRLRTVIIRPNWKKYGSSAGFRRNKEIVLAAHEVVAFWDGVSPGTENTIKHAIRLRRPVAVFSTQGQLIRYVEPGAEVETAMAQVRSRKRKLVAT